MRYLKYLPAILLLLFIFSAETIKAQNKQFIASIDQDGVQRVEVLAGEYFFDPNYIVVKVNVPVEIKIKKEPTIVPHSFVIKAPDAGMDINEPVSLSPRKLARVSIIKIPSAIGILYCNRLGMADAMASTPAVKLTAAVST